MSTCPHCGYDDALINDPTNRFGVREPEEGDMFELELTLKRERTVPYDEPDIQTMKLYGCPKCNKTFIGY